MKEQNKVYRLVVHLDKLKKDKVTNKLYNTRTYNWVNELDAESIISNLKSEGLSITKKEIKLI